MAKGFAAAEKIGRKALEDRGILQQALLHRWKWYQGGWSYPLFTEKGSLPTPEVLRFKRFAGVPGLSKYTWITGKMHASDYYFEPGTPIETEVKEQGGVLYIANGEPSTLAFRSADIHNAVCWFGEANIPRTLVVDLQKWGVKKVINYPDCDNTGLQASRKLCDLLEGKIEYEAYRIPEEEGSKKDINDLWYTARFNKDTFRKYLPALARIDHSAIPPPPRRPLLPEAELLDRSDFLAKDRRPWQSLTPAEKVERRLLTEKVEAALGVAAMEYNHNGWAGTPVQCLLRNHEHDYCRPKAFWNRSGALLWCFKCGQTLHLEHCAQILKVSLTGAFS
eukprot:EG_transcript_14342